MSCHTLLSRVVAPLQTLEDDVVKDILSWHQLQHDCHVIQQHYQTKQKQQALSTTVVGKPSSCSCEGAGARLEALLYNDPINSCLKHACRAATLDQVNRCLIVAQELQEALQPAYTHCHPAMLSIVVSELTALLAEQQQRTAGGAGSSSLLGLLGFRGHSTSDATHMADALVACSQQQTPGSTATSSRCSAHHEQALLRCAVMLETLRVLQWLLWLSTAID
eukprot:jgi/Chrzof1/10039/Cz04g24300.t1